MIAAATAACAAACAAEPEGDDPEVAGDAALVITRSLYQSAGAKSLAVSDAAVEGARVVALVNTGATTFTSQSTILIDEYGNYAGELPAGGGSYTSVGSELYRSEDEGRSWRRAPLAGGPFYGVILHKGVTYLLQAVIHGSALGQTNHLQVWRLDDVSGSVTKVGPELSGSRAALSEGRLETYVHEPHAVPADPDLSPASIDGAYRWQRLDLGSGAFVEKVQPFTAGEYRCKRPALGMVTGDGGWSWHGWTSCETAAGTQVCRLRVEPRPVFVHDVPSAQLAPVAQCAPAIDLPWWRWDPILLDGGSTPALGNVSGAPGDQHEVVLWRSDGGLALTPLPLGVGAWVPSWGSFGVRGTFQNLVGVRAQAVAGATAPTSWFRVDGGGAARLGFRASVCAHPDKVQANGIRCSGVPALARKLPGAPERWLVLHSVRSVRPTDPSGRTTGWIYATREAITPEPWVRPLPAALAAREASIARGCTPAIAAATPLEQACLRLASHCPSQAGLSVGGCIEHYLRADAATQAAFVAAKPSCPNQPHWTPPAPAAGAGCASASVQCVDGALTSCAQSVTTALDCAAMGRTCAVAAVAPGVVATPACGADACPTLGWSAQPPTPDPTWLGGRCQGDRVVVRVVGAVRVLSCAALDLGPCKASMVGTNFASARCALDKPPPTDRYLGGADAGPLELACALAVACLDGSGLLPGETWWSYQRACVDAGVVGSRAVDDASDAAWQRLLAAKDCPALRAALPSVLPSGAPCATPSAAVCDGDAVRWCGEQGTLSVGTDCAAFGATCGSVQGEPACVAPAGACANAGADGLGCSSAGACYFPQQAKHVSWGLSAPLHFAACKARGLTCVSTASDPTFPAVDCMKVDPAWPQGGAFCVGKTAWRHGPWPQVAAPTAHCDRLPGFVCHSDASGSFAQCAPAKADAVYRGLPQCDGSVLRYDIDAAVRKLDCAALGLACVADPARGARCQ